MDVRSRRIVVVEMFLFDFPLEGSLRSPRVLHLTELGCLSFPVMILSKRWGRFGIGIALFATRFLYWRLGWFNILLNLDRSNRPEMF